MLSVRRKRMPTGASTLHRWGLLAAAALAASLLPGPRAAAGGDQAFVVHAAGTAVVAFEVPGGFSVDTGQWSLSGKGTYKVALLDRTVPDRAAAGWNLLLAQVPSFGEHSRVTLGAVGEARMTSVPAGRYRLHLISDAP